MSEEEKPLLFQWMDSIGKAVEDFFSWLDGLFAPKQPEQKEEPPAPEEPKTPVEDKPSYGTIPKGADPRDYSSRTGGTFDGRETPRETR